MHRLDVSKASRSASPTPALPSFPTKTPEDDKTGLGMPTNDKRLLAMPAAEKKAHWKRLVEERRVTEKEEEERKAARAVAQGSVHQPPAQKEEEEEGSSAADDLPANSSHATARPAGSASLWSSDLKSRIKARIETSEAELTKEAHASRWSRSML